MAAINHTLGASQRLKRQKLFEEIFSTGSVIRASHVSVFYKETPLPAEENIQAGFSVSKRKFKRAVDRNRLKRLMREAYRLQCNDFKNLLKTHNRQIAVVFVFTFTSQVAFSEVKTDVFTLLNNLEKQFK